MTKADPSVSPVRVLHLEDDEDDHVLLREMLEAEGLRCEFDLARSRSEFEAALQGGPYNLIISDYSLPSYDGLRALALARQQQSQAPFIFFSGTISDELAVESLRNGATDYVVKQRPGRLVATVRRALQEVEERRRLEQTEEKIREQAALLDKAHDAIIVCDLDGQVIFWNRSAERIYGWSAAEAVGRRVGELLFNQMPLSFDEARKSVVELGEWLGEFQQITKEGKPVTVQSSWTLVRDEEGRPKSELIINTDITEQKQLEEQFFRAQRLESLGVLVGGIAHDLNNALTPVLMGASLLQMLPLPEDAMGILKTMTASARRGAEMVQQILTFARGGGGEKSRIQVDQLVKEMRKIINDTFPKSIECRAKVEQGSWPVQGFATHLHQVIMNLCINARDAMAQGGTLTLATQNVVVDEVQAARHSGAEPGRYLCLSVEDTGVGILPDQLPQIFQPFFTTKAPGHGTGLGLSTSLTIVKNHGGFMTVESTAGRGTEFMVYLPAVEASGEVEPPPAAPMLPAGNGEGILMVDDEAAILALAKTTLENYGYRVFTAASGPEAVTLFTSERDAVQLVITDKSMPFMDGNATILALREVKPEVKTIVTSGHDRAKETETDRQIKADAFMEKPFTVEKLLTTVHGVLVNKT